MKNLLYITTNVQGSGGVSRILSVKLNYLIETYNYHITVVNSNSTGVDFFYKFSPDIKFHHLNSKQLLRYKKELNNILKIVSPDIIINCDNGFKGSLLPYLITTKRHLIYERHCSKNITTNSFYDKLKLKASIFLLERSINEYKEFVVLNNNEKKDWARNDVKIIPNPLWLQPQKKLNVKNTKVAIAVGRHAYEKRYDKLIAIWAKVVKKHPDWILKIYGEKNEKLNLARLVKDFKVQKNVQFHVPINNLHKIYSEANILLTTSESESFGLVLIEAMAFGVSVIAFGGTSGTETLIQNGVNGFVIQKDAIASYVEKTNILIENVDLRQNMSENAIKSLENFKIDSIMNLWHKIFQS